MKKPITFFIILTCICSFNIKAQIDSGNIIIPIFQCDFESQCPKVILYSQIPGNLWQVGIPSKTIFNAAHSPVKALVTDTANAYPNSNHSWFDLILLEPWEYYNPLVSFYHKWDMDSLTEGGWIDISYDNGLSWKNVINDTVGFSYNYPYINSNNLYGINDTLDNGNPAFTGSSNGWVLTQLQWVWFIPIKKMDSPQGDTIRLRFHFLSDSTQTSKDGWMIDDLRIDNVQYLGSIGEYESNTAIKLWPNPASNELQFTVSNKMLISANILGYDGRLIFAIEDLRGLEKLSIAALKPGIYLLEVQTEDGILIRQSFIKG